MRLGGWLRRAGWAAMAVVAVGVSRAQPPATVDPIGELIASKAAPAWEAGFERDYLAPLRTVSCPSGAKRVAPADLAIKATPVPLQGLNPFRKEVGKLTFVAGFHLTSTEERFGGLSGLDVRADDGLLAVSDEGDFVWVDLAADGVTPTSARIASMLDAKGAPLSGKADGDAEGLALNGDIALVSFERNHRLLAFDIGKCGAVARGAPVTFGAFGGRFDKAFQRAKVQIESNQGPEGLAITPDWRVFAGLEAPARQGALVSARAIEARPEFDLAIGAGAPELVGLDILPVGGESEDVRLFSLHRASGTPLATNAITVVESRLTPELEQPESQARVSGEVPERARLRYRVVSTRILAEMNVMLTVDNFEGLAAKALPGGGVRFFIVSDNNFSARQRTLLMVYDLKS